MTWPRHFGRLHVRGRYCASDGSPPIEERAWLVTGRSDDSGNLKGALRKLGRKYGQDAVIHKGYYRDAELHALKDLPDLGMADKEKKTIGRFHPNRVGLYQGDSKNRIQAGVTRQANRIL